MATATVQTVKRVTLEMTQDEAQLVTLILGRFTGRMCKQMIGSAMSATREEMQEMNSSLYAALIDVAFDGEHGYTQGVPVTV